MGKDAAPILKRVQRLRTGKIKTEHTKIKTTLYDLVEAVMEEAGAKESGLVTLVVLRLLGKAKPLETSATVH